MPRASRQRERVPEKNWFARNINLNTIITVVILMGGWVSQWASTRAILNDHERRITTIEKDYIPRNEQESKEKLWDTRFSTIESLLRDLLYQAHTQALTTSPIR